jgi:hypothetical protein
LKAGATDDDMMGAKELHSQVRSPLGNQIIEEKQVETMKISRRRSIKSADANLPKQKVTKKLKKKPNEISNYSKIPDNMSEFMFSTDTIDDNTTTHPQLHFEQVLLWTHPFARWKHNLFYVILFSIVLAIISTSFYFFK